MLQQPISKLLNSARSVVLAGCGSGYDVFGAVPLLFELALQGRQVHLASLSHADLPSLPGAAAFPGCANLYKIGVGAATTDTFCPEAWLSRWVEEKLGRRIPVWCMKPDGVQPLRRAWSQLLTHCEADCVILVDGGLDCVLRGDEVSIGSPDEDVSILAAISGIDSVRKFIAGLGLGAGLGFGVHHADILQRIAELTRERGFLGGTVLNGNNTAGTLYREALQFAFDHQPGLPRSHIHEAILRSLEGDFGAEYTKGWVSPLLSIYWFFDLMAVARTNVLLPCVDGTQTFEEVGACIQRARAGMNLRHSGTIPP
ncbi:MAG: DUF1152 domain-containing protein [Deltaproteobacteria bacterium]|nr:DUF1152 domain-containing protein [Deltaproteobacteria bacterium]